MELSLNVFFYVVHGIILYYCVFVAYFAVLSLFRSESASNIRLGGAANTERVVSEKTSRLPSTSSA